MDGDNGLVSSVTFGSTDDGGNAFLGILDSYLLVRGPAFVYRIVNLADGKTVGAVRLQMPTGAEFASCVPFVSNETAVAFEVSFRESSNENGDRFSVFGQFDFRGGEWRWRSPKASSQNMYMIDAGETGPLFFSSTGSIEAMLSSGSARTQLDQRGLDLLVPASISGSGGLVAWSKLVGDASVVRTWDADGGAADLLASPDLTCNLSAGADQLVGFSGYSDSTTGCSGPLRNSYFWAVRPGEESRRVIPVEHQLQVFSLASAGEHAAAIVRPTGEAPSIYLINVRDRVVRALHPQPVGGVYAVAGKGLGLTSTALYCVVEKAGLGGGIDQVLRFDLSNIDAFGAKVR